MIDSEMKLEPSGTAAGLLAVDVDGTLITDHGEITVRVREALEAVAAAGWEVVIATGRTLYAARRVIETLPFIRYALLSNGACIVNVKNSDVLHLDVIPPETVEDVVKVIRGNGSIPVLYNADIHDPRIYYDTLENACPFFEWYVGQDKRAERVAEVMQYAGNIQQIGTIDARDTVFRIRNELLANHRATPMPLPFESPHFGGKNHDFWFLQVLREGVSKNTAIQRISGWLDIPGGRVVAVGDNYNDADMIAGADVGVAMGNAPEEIKRLARMVVGTNNDSGLAEVAEKVILSGKFF